MSDDKKTPYLQALDTINYELKRHNIEFFVIVFDRGQFRINYDGHSVDDAKLSKDLETHIVGIEVRDE